MYEPRFLLWLLEQSGADQDVPVSSGLFAAQQSIPLDVVEAVVDRLRDLALVRSYGNRPDGPRVSLRPDGVVRARRLQARRADPAERGRHARRAVLTWIFDNSERRPLPIEEFFDSRGIFFLGEPLTRGEVARTLSYLSSVGLIDCAGPVFVEPVRSHVTLTLLGMDCVLSGSDAGEFVAQRRERDRPLAGGVVMNGPVTGPVTGGDTTVHGDLTIQQTVQASDVAAMVRQFAPTLGLDEETLRGLLDDADRLRRQTGDPDGDPPDRGRLQHLTDRMRSVLRSAPETVGRQLMLDVVGQLLTRLWG